MAVSPPYRLNMNAREVFDAATQTAIDNNVWGPGLTIPGLCDWHRDTTNRFLAPPNDTLTLNQYLALYDDLTGEENANDRRILASTFLQAIMFPVVFNDFRKPQSQNRILQQCCKNRMTAAYMLALFGPTIPEPFLSTARERANSALRAQLEQGGELDAYKRIYPDEGPR